MPYSPNPLKFLDQLLSFCVRYGTTHDTDSPGERMRDIVQKLITPGSGGPWSDAPWTSDGDQDADKLAPSAAKPENKLEAERLVSELLTMWPYDSDDELAFCHSFRAGAYLAGRSIDLEASYLPAGPLPSSRVVADVWREVTFDLIKSKTLLETRRTVRRHLNQFVLIAPTRPQLIQSLRRDFDEHFFRRYMSLLTSHKIVETPATADKDELLDTYFRYHLLTQARWLTDWSHGHTETIKLVEGTVGLVSVLLAGNTLRAQALAGEAVAASHMAAVADLLRVPALPFPADRAQNIGQGLSGAPWPGVGGPLQSVLRLFSGNWDKLFNGP